jgi:hypothetical protein
VERGRKEEEKRIRVEEERKAAAGGFPTLAHSESTPGTAPVQPAPTTHKAPSIGGTKGAGEKGKVTLSSYAQPVYAYTSPAIFLVVDSWTS